MNLNIGKNMTVLEILMLNFKKISHVSKFIELMFKGELHCFQGYFRKHTHGVLPLPLFLQGAEKFSMLAKGGDLHFLNF